VTRTFRDGHAETWWAAEATLGWWGPGGARRLAVAPADPGTLPGKATWFKRELARRAGIGIAPQDVDGQAEVAVYSNMQGRLIEMPHFGDAERQPIVRNTTFD
jgi:hypothetical protein